MNTIPKDVSQDKKHKIFTYRGTSLDAYQFSKYPIIKTISISSKIENIKTIYKIYIFILFLNFKHIFIDFIYTLCNIIVL